MFGTSSRNESSSLLKKATKGYLTYKALPLGSSRKREETSVIKRIAQGFLAMKVLSKSVKWIGGGALLFAGAKYGYAKYNERKTGSGSEPHSTEI